MTEREWNLTRDLLQTRLLFWEVQGQLILKLSTETRKELAELGETWKPEVLKGDHPVLQEVVNE